MHQINKCVVCIQVCIITNIYILHPYKFILDQRFSIFEMFKDNPSSKTIFIHLYFRFVDMLYANMLIEHKQSSMKSLFFSNENLQIIKVLRSIYVEDLA